MKVTLYHKLLTQQDIRYTYFVTPLYAMYALPNKTQHKLIVKVRGGISQKLDNLTSPTASTSNNQNSSSSFKTGFLASLGSKHPIVDEAGFNAELNHLPQPIFHSITEKNGSKNKSTSSQQKLQNKQQYITPEHYEMIKFVQHTWKGVERDYKKSANNYINNLDLNNDSSTIDHHHVNPKPTKHVGAKKKLSTSSTPLLLTGSYHHTSSSMKQTGTNNTNDSFQPFDLETFWGNRILKRLIEDDRN